jgi:hypothetical protein
MVENSFIKLSTVKSYVRTGKLGRADAFCFFRNANNISFYHY